ncbi:Putrescine oxidase, putative [Pediculus humanus corporis]|uniref:Putrescine oxidase, putative n=1 Tax=Pediculus humanus subsp. corporis TaxID=121224 RepID=E0VYB5_PEDHC|nr:Putrescine oxidase, putative [Pediculus humanus corporis]EEB18371.1 Putrescine oxidase, putative [Pediculus humanus corporis]
MEDYHLELGAQWIHGEKNKVFKICEENRLLTEEHSGEGEGLYLRENGETIDESLVREIDDVIKNILENCENYYYNVSSMGFDENYHNSIGNELMTKFNEYLNEHCAEDSVKVKEIKRDLLDWHTRFQLIDNSCSDLHNLSAKAWGLFKFCGGKDYVNFKKGYSSLIDVLINSLPENSIVYETPVQRIDWVSEDNKTKRSNITPYNDRQYNNNNNNNVKITCKNGLTFYAQHVIVTCSLGYLKLNYKTMFYPPLPNYLSEAIELLDFGVLDKIFLIYEKKWWDSGVKGFQLVWSQSVESEGERGKHWGKYVTGFDVIIKDKPVLLGWIGGEGAKIVERLTEEEIGRDATDILRKFCNRTDVPHPKKVIRSTWWSNEYVRGGYSHITVKCDEPKINGSNLAQPVYTTLGGYEPGIASGMTDELDNKPTILLAGECTHMNYFSTVHGAYESGQNQARVILDYQKQIDH